MPFLWLIAIGVIGYIMLKPKEALGYIAGKPVWLTLGQIVGGLYLERQAAEAYNRMYSAAKLDGVTLLPSGPRSAFRTEADQLAMTIERTAYAAPVNRSPHQAGKAIDLDTDNGTNAAFKWLTVNATKFGFHRTVAREPWHWEYLGS